MAHMQVQILYSRWFEVDTTDGTEWIEQDLIGNTTSPSLTELQTYCLGRVQHFVRVIDGYGVRLSAPGYSDCTEWSVFLDRDDAERYGRELAGED